MPVGSNEGYSDLAEPSLKHGGRTMTEYSEVFVAFDTSKTKHAVAVAEGGRDGEIRYLAHLAGLFTPAAPERNLQALH